jgi:UDP-N-acetylglucosamine 2-epimerase (hydrolysing)
MRRILFISGTRADFGKLDPLARAAEASGFEVMFLVCGMHMMPKYGLTKKEVTDRYKTFECVNQKDGDSLDLILTKSISSFSDIFRIIEPDLVVHHGDRVEAFASSIVCATNCIRSAHIEGGEVSGTIDEIFRHCNSKLSDMHFVSSLKAFDLLVNLGEPPKKIHIIGSPEFDLHEEFSDIPLQDVLDHYEIVFDEYGIAIFHPVFSEQDLIGGHAQTFFDAIEGSEKNFVIIEPNNDDGSNAIRAVLDKKRDNQRLRILPSMRFSYFSRLLRGAKLFIGNSSVAVREAPYLGIASISVGSRQAGRTNNKEVNIIDVFEKNRIESSINRDWGLKRSVSKEFGSAGSSAKFVEVLKAIDWTISLQKQFFRPNSD